MSHRDRAWRRRQRTRKIKSRQDRLPEVPVPGSVQLWQLHGPDGKPLDVLKRLSTHRKMQSLEDVPVKVRHAYGCHLGPPRWAWKDGTYQGVHDEGPCQCKGRLPGWASPLSPELGSFWRFVREYTPDHRLFPEGKLDKSPPAGDRASWSPAGSDTGNMQFMLSNHRGKLYLGSKGLGRDAVKPDRHWREWEDSWDGSEWGYPKPEDE